MKKRVLFIGVGVIVALAVLWWTLSPLFLNKVVNEELPSGSDGGIGDRVSGNVLVQGSFVDADSFHKASGVAKVVEVEGARYLNLEDFEATNGPDLYVYLSTDKGNDDFVNLGELKGNVGSQTYEVPPDVDLEKYDNVLIWCRAFGVLFGSSELG